MGKTRQAVTVLPSRNLDPDLVIRADRPETWNNSAAFINYLAELAGTRRTNVTCSIKQLLAIRRWGEDDRAMANLAPLMIDTKINGEGAERAHTILAWHQETLADLLVRAGLENGPIDQVYYRIEQETKELFGSFKVLVNQGFDQYGMVLANTSQRLINGAVNELEGEPADILEMSFISAIAIGNRRSGYDDLPEMMQERIDCLIGDLVQARR